MPNLRQSAAARRPVRPLALAGLLSAGVTVAAGATAAPKAEALGQVSGLVQFDGKAVAGIKVRLCPTGQMACRAPTGYETTTDTEGRYRFDKVKEGLYTVAANLFATNTLVFGTVVGPLGPAGPNTYSVWGGNAVKVPPIHLFKSDLKPISPQPGATVKTSKPVFEWQPYPGATRYTVTLRPEGLPGLHPEDALSTEATRLEAQNEVLNGAYSWRLRAFNAEGIKLAETEATRFKVLGSHSPPGPVKLLAPKHGDTTVVGSGLRFDWTPEPKAKAYALELARDTSPGFPGFTKTVDVPAPGHVWDYTLPAGKYRWRVWTTADNKRLSVSEYARFEIK